jgi:hypothetical protein
MVWYAIMKVDILQKNVKAVIIAVHTALQQESFS